MFQSLWLFIYGILYATASKDDVTIKSISEEYHTDNLVLESLSRDDNTNIDNTLEIELPDTNKNNVASDIDENDNFRRNFKDDNPEQFTDFIKTVINTLKKYTDADLEHFFDIFNDEVGKYHYNGCKFHELTQNDAFSEFVDRQFDDITNKPAADIRQNIVKIARQIEKATHNPYEKKLIDYVNSLYKRDSIQKFNKLLTKINDYRLKTNEDLDLTKIIRNGIRSLVFNHYTKLDYNTRAEIKFKLDRYWEYLMGPPSLRASLSDKDDQLLDNKHKLTRNIYDTKNGKYKSATNKHSKIRNLKVMRSHAKSVDDQKIMGPLKKPDWRQNTASHISTSELVLYRSDRNNIQEGRKQIVIEDFESIKESTNQYTKPSTKDIRQEYASDSNNDYSAEDNSTENDTNDDTSDNLPLFVYKKDSVTPAKTYMSLYTEDIDIPTKKQLQTEEEYIQDRYRYRRPSSVKHKDSKDTKASIASLYTIDFLDTTTDEPQMMIRRSTSSKSYHTKPAHKSKIHTPENNLATPEARGITPTAFRRDQTFEQFIEWATLRSSVPKEIDKSKKLRIDKTQLHFRRQQPDKLVHTNFNEDASIVDNDLFEEDDKENDGTLFYRRNYGNQLPDNTILIDKGVLDRLQDLQNQLDDVKSLVKNDTEMIKQLKSNMSLSDPKSSNEYVLAKVIPCTKEGREIRDSHFEDVDNVNPTNTDHKINDYDKSIYLANHEHSYNKINRRMQNDYETNHINVENNTKYNSDSEREVMPDLNRLQYKINKNNVNRFDSKHQLHKNSRRKMKNKAEEIKDKLNRSTKSVNINKRQEKHMNRKSNINTNKKGVTTKKKKYARYNSTIDSSRYKHNKKNNDATRKDKNLKNFTKITSHNKTVFHSALTNMNTTKKFQLDLLNYSTPMKNSVKEIRNKLNGTTKSIDRNKRRQEKHKNQNANVANVDTTKKGKTTNKKKYTSYETTIDKVSYNNINNSHNSTRNTTKIKNYTTSISSVTQKTTFQSTLRNLNTTKKLKTDSFKTKITANLNTSDSKNIQSLNKTIKLTDKSRADIVTKSYSNISITQRYLENNSISSKLQNNTKSSRNESEIHINTKVRQTVTVKNTLQTKFDFINNTDEYNAHKKKF